MAKFNHLAIDNSEVREIVKELNRYGKKDVLKALRAFNREIAKEVSDKARKLGAKQYDQQKILNHKQQEHKQKLK